MDHLKKFTLPEWASRLRCVPEYTIQLTHANTPVHEWNLPGVPPEFTVHIKREDMTGSVLLGNKVRKLELTLAKALALGCRHVISDGAEYSNHCQALAAAARRVGLTPHLVLASEAKEASELGCEATLLLNRMCGAYMYLSPRNVLDTATSVVLEQKKKKIAEKIRAETGETSFLIPIGGSDLTSLFAYIAMFEELKQQGVHEMYDDIVVAFGSGGTVAGLAIGNYLTGSHLRCHAVHVGNDGETFKEQLTQQMKEIGLNVRSEDIIDFIWDYRGEGYGIWTPDILDFILDVYIATGILLEPVYTGKAAYGMIKEIRNNPQRFNGHRILFIHTGGLFGLFNGAMSRLLKRPGMASDRVMMWTELDKGGPEYKEYGKV